MMSRTKVYFSLRCRLKSFVAQNWLCKTSYYLDLLQLKDRTDQSHGTWEEVYRNAKRAVRSKHDLHDRDEGELERTGQPLCIYEPYFGEGTWPFLHSSSLYHGIGLVSSQP